MSNLDKKFQRSNAFSRLQQLYKKVDDVKGGKDSLTAAGTAYLPRLPAESAANYQHRLDVAVFKPIYPRTIEKGVGKAFLKGITVKTKPEFGRLIDNADGAGTSLETFAKELLYDAIHYGITYLLVDYPITTPNQTLADERASGAFPYFVNIKPTSVLDLRTQFNGAGVEVVYFRFLEEVEEFDAMWNCTTIQQVKEFIVTCVSFINIICLTVVKMAESRATGSISSLVTNNVFITITNSIDSIG